MEPVTVRVAAALIYRQGRLLVCQRSDTATFPRKWEFPGGKVERGEGYLAALRRELNEELGIGIESASEIFRHRHAYPGWDEVELVFFRVENFQGEAANRIFRQILWVEIQELEKLDFLDGDLPLIEKLTRREISL